MKQRKLSSILSLVLSLVLVITSITITPTKAEEIKAQDFYFPHIITGSEDISSQFYYSDSYFTQSSYTYNPSLATLSCCMASSAVGCTDRTADGKYDYSKFDSNVKDLLTKAGFTDFYSNEDYTTKPTKDTVGYAFAKKTIKQDGKDITLIAVNLRNAMYEKEWANNFLLGSNGLHQGFQTSGDKVIEGLKTYVNDNGIQGNVKVWVAGYSRGAGIANYIGYALDKAGYVGGADINKEDLYVYTFGTPNTTTNADYKKSVYRNIFNIFSTYDLVAKIAPEQWNWHRYGVEVLLPKASDDNYAAKKERAQKFLDKILKDTPVVADVVPGYKVELAGITTEGITVLPDGTKDVAVLLDDIMTALAVNLESTEKFNEYYPVISTAIDTYMDLTDEQKSALLNYIVTKAQEIGLGALVFDLLGGGDQAVNLIIDGLHEIGVTLENEDELKPILKQALTKVLQTLVVEINNLPSSGYTLYQSLYPIVGNHADFTILAWLQSFDSNYKLDSDNPPTPVPVIEVPGKAKVTSAKKKSNKKVLVKIKKIKSAKGYQVAVYKSTKKAKKNKGALVKKYTKKTKITISSKKFKKRKKLYVKARAYTLDGKKKVFGKWSKIKKVKK